MDILKGIYSKYPPFGVFQFSESVCGEKITIFVRVNKEHIYRLRVIVFFLLTIIVYLTNNLQFLFFELIAAIILFFSLRANLKLLKSLFYANIFTFFIVLSLLILNFHKNLNLALEIFLKSNTILVLTFGLVIPIGVLNLIKTLEDLYFPKKLTFLTFLAYRYISTLEREYKNLKKAILLRGFEPKTSLGTYKTYGYLLGVLILKTFLKAREVYKATVLRGWEL